MWRGTILTQHKTKFAETGTLRNSPKSAHIGPFRVSLFTKFTVLLNGYCLEKAFDKADTVHKIRLCNIVNFLEATPWNKFLRFESGRIDGIMVRLVCPNPHSQKKEKPGLVVRVSGYRSRGPVFDSRRFQIFWEAAGLERGPLSLVRTTEELLEGKSSCSGLENRG
jgi:hypothetical protein